MKTTMLTTTMFLPVPDWHGFYEINQDGDVQSVERTIIRRNGRPYRVRARIMAQSVHPRSELKSVLLSRPGFHERIHPHAVVREVFKESL